MTSIEMLKEFKVGIDKIDSDSYPEIYNEQIFMFINKAIDELVNEGRRVFEKDQIITDNLKSLIPKLPAKIIPIKDDEYDVYYFNLDKELGYLFYINASIFTSVGKLSGKAGVDIVQHNDINTLLVDPYNQPKPYKVPVTFAKDTIVAYASPVFKITSMLLTYVKQPATVSLTTNCDLEPQLHYAIVDRAVTLAAVSLGMTNNKQ